MFLQQSQEFILHTTIQLSGVYCFGVLLNCFQILVLLLFQVSQVDFVQRGFSRYGRFDSWKTCQVSFDFKGHVAVKSMVMGTNQSQ